MSKICCFAGHSKIYDKSDLTVLLYEKCEELIKNNEADTFWVGNYGDFDALASHIVRKIKKAYPFVRLELVVPYLTKDINEYKEQYYKNYDSILIANIPENTHYKYKIIKCNQYMVDKSDYLIAYVNFPFGGAVKTLEYAKKRNIKIISLI